MAQALNFLCGIVNARQGMCEKVWPVDAVMERIEVEQVEKALECGLGKG